LFGFLFGSWAASDKAHKNKATSENHFIFSSLLRGFEVATSRRGFSFVPVPFVNA